MNNPDLPTEASQYYLVTLFYVFAFLYIISGIILAVIFWPKYSYSISFLLVGLFQAVVCVSIAHIISYLHSIAHNTDNVIRNKFSSYAPIGMKKCPFCEEYIKSGALKCPYCTSEIPVEEKRISNRKSGEFGPVNSQRSNVRNKVILCKSCGMAHNIDQKGKVCECGLLLK